MTQQQRQEIERLLGQICAPKEVELAFRTPQAFLNGGYIENHPLEAIAALQEIVDRNYK